MANYGSAGGSMKCIYNFGARGSFAYTPPTGYKALCTEKFDDTAYAPVLNVILILQQALGLYLQTMLTQLFLA